MGQKVNPVGLRLGINRTWDSRWYSGRREYGQLLHEDMKIREYLREQLKQAGISKILIERPQGTTVDQVADAADAEHLGADEPRVLELHGHGPRWAGTPFEASK